MYSGSSASPCPFQINTLSDKVSKSKHPDVRNRLAFVRHSRFPVFVSVLEKEKYRCGLHG
jgi:hypothetical protein